MMDFASLFHVIEEKAHAADDITTAMAAVISQCESMRPHKDWQRLAALPYHETEALHEWIERPFDYDPPDATTAGLWFGIFNPVSKDGRPVADMYLAGSNRFEASQEDNTWAVDPDWWPRDRRAESTILADIFRIAYADKDGLRNDAEYPLCLAYACFAAKELVSLNAEMIAACSDQQMGVATGFDSGDFILLGELTRQGLVAV